MTLTLVGEKREGQGSIRSTNGLPVYDATYTYLVRSTDKTTERLDVMAFNQLPVVGLSADPSGVAICRTKNATRRADNPLLWDVVVTFSSDVSEKSSNQDPDSDPTVWTPIYETKFERLQEVVTRDLDGDAVANSAGQAFETGLTIARFIPVWEFFQFESAAVGDQQIIDRNETINSGGFKGRAAETLLLTVMSSVVGFYYGRRLRLTQYSLKYNERTWRHKRLDVGNVFKQPVFGGGFILRPNEIKGALVPCALNGAGFKQPDGVAPFVLEFDIYKKIDFSFLRG